MTHSFTLSPRALGAVFGLPLALAAGGALADDAAVEAGKTLYADNCAACHSAMAPSAADMGAMEADAFTTAMAGHMDVGVALSEADLAALHAYLETAAE